MLELSTQTLLMIALALVALAFTWAASLHLKFQKEKRPTLWQGMIGFITNFFDTLGIGSYATTTALWRIQRTVDDRLLPGTLNVGHAWPTFVQAAIFLGTVAVSDLTLVLLITASVLGAWFGAGFAVRLSREKVRVFVGTGLAVAALLMLLGLLEALPVGGTSLELGGWKLTVGVIACAVFGGLMTLGIGAYAPIMITVSLLGMNPTAAFPIMMGACAFLIPTANFRFLKTGSYSPSAALGLTLGGIPGVLIAAWVVKSLPLTLLKVLVIGVASYTALQLFRESKGKDRQ